MAAGLPFAGITEETRVCANCKHFKQHYIKEDGRFVICITGSCIYPSVRNRYVDGCCRNFRNKNIH
jgi:hypothetical protein